MFLKFGKVIGHHMLTKLVQLLFGRNFHWSKIDHFYSVFVWKFNMFGSHYPVRVFFNLFGSVHPKVPFRQKFVTQFCPFCSSLGSLAVIFRICHKYVFSSSAG